MILIVLCSVVYFAGVACAYFLLRVMFGHGSEIESDVYWMSWFWFLSGPILAFALVIYGIARIVEPIVKLTTQSIDKAADRIRCAMQRESDDR